MQLQHGPIPTDGAGKPTGRVVSARFLRLHTQSLPAADAALPWPAQPRPRAAHFTFLSRRLGPASLGPRQCLGSSNIYRTASMLPCVEPDEVGGASPC